MKSKYLGEGIVVAITFVAMMSVNVLANTLPINGVTSKQVSDSYPNLFAPAPTTFAIWGVIYLLLLGYVLYQAGILGKNNEKLNHEINKYFLPNMVANGVWLVTWHYGIIWLSVMVMGVILTTLIKIANLIKKNKLGVKERAFIATPMSVYFGWITVATIANITVFLVSTGWNGWGISQEAWTIAILLIGAGIGITRLLSDRRVAYGLVLIWAYYGIWTQHISVDGFGGQYPQIVRTLIFCGVLFLAAEIIVLLKKGKIMEIKKS
ncbi:MAG: tryptophan-rich sensory protein [Candidatus Shapirobacteria bacterium]